MIAFKNYAEMIDFVKTSSTKKRCAVVQANSKHTLEAIVCAFTDGFVEPLLIGNEVSIRKHLSEIGKKSAQEIAIIPTSNAEESAQKAIDLVRLNQADMIMKGHVETAVLMHSVVKNRSWMQTGNIISILGAMELAFYHKLLFHTDGGLIPHPDLHQKKMMIENAVIVLRRLGIDCPKVAVLAGVEKVSSNMPETVVAHALKEMNLRGEIKNCIVEGPIPWDMAVHKEAALLKEFESHVAGDTDLLIWPDMTSGNIIAKAFNFSGIGKAASCVIGTKAPIIMSSRASEREEKYRSVALASAVA